jgi:phosphoribosyl 1,2-cyclic phosphate phosphodiesterase
MGRRVFEPLNWDVQEWPWRPRITEVYLPAQVAADFRTRLASAEHLAYLQHIGIVRVHVVPDGERVTVSGLTVTPFRLAEDYVYAFLIEEGDTRVLLAPDELHGWSPPAWLQGVDLAILPMGICVHDPFTGQRRMSESHPLLQEEASFPATLEIVRALGSPRVILSHIEEMDGLGHDQLEVLAKRLNADGLPIAFAHDTMRIEV